MNTKEKKNMIQVNPYYEKWYWQKKKKKEYCFSGFFFFGGGEGWGMISHYQNSIEESL